MKNLKVEGKLSINKERVSMLNGSEMRSIQGGAEEGEFLSISRRCSNLSRCSVHNATKQLFCVPNAY